MILRQTIKTKIHFLLWVVCFFTVVIYRINIIEKYCIHYVDEDQALLWYGTARAAHLELFEPHFFGQAYGSMLESFLAVPLYWLKVPLNVCVPISTFVLWFSPFLLVSIINYRKKRYIFSYVVFLMSLLFSFNYDVLTSIPRSFICGFIFAFIAHYLLNEIKTGKAVFIAWILYAIAFICTENTITIIGMSLLYYVLYNFSEIRRKIIYHICGIFGSGILIYYCDVFFYKRHPEYNLHVQPQLSFSFAIFLDNINHIKEMLSDFSIVTLYGVPLALIIFFCSIIMIAIYIKDVRIVLLILASICGSTLFLFLNKTLQYRDSLLYSQSRMFLFIPYIILLSTIFIGELNLSIKNEWIINTLICVLVLCVGLYKIYIFNNVVLYDNDLIKCDFIGTMRVSDVYEASNIIKERVVQDNLDTVLFIDDDRVMGYATAAINYDLYISYNAFYDRRTFIFDYLRYTNYDKSVLVIRSDSNQIQNMSTEDMCGMCPVYWILNRYGIQRYPRDSRFYIQY